MIINSQTQTTLDQYQHFQILGQGNFCKVRLARHIQSGNIYAIKYINLTTNHRIQQIYSQLLFSQHQLLQKLESPFFLKSYDFHSDSVLKKQGSKNSEKKVAYFVIQLAEKGGLMKVIEKSWFDESFARYYLSQLIQALQNLNSSEMYHGALSAKNLLLDKDGNLKLGSLSVKDESHDEGVISIPCTVYTPPEVRLGMSYAGISSDIFSLGIILFQMVMKCFPFSRAALSDPLFQYIAKNKVLLYWDAIWKKNQQIHQQTKISSELISLISKMFSLNPSDRPTLQQIKNSQWMKGSMPTPQQVSHKIQLHLDDIEIQDLNIQKDKTTIKPNKLLSVFRGHKIERNLGKCN